MGSAASKTVFRAPKYKGFSVKSLASYECKIVHQILSHKKFTIYILFWKWGHKDYISFALLDLGTSGFFRICEDMGCKDTPCQEQNICHSDMVSV